MPMRNGTGPAGMGPMTGRGMGFCADGYSAGRGAGFGGWGFTRRMAGRGYGRGYGAAPVMTDREYREALQQEAAFLEERLNAVRDELNSKDEKSAT